MAAAKKKVGDLIKEGRTKAGLSQDKLAQQVEGLSASDVSKAERGEKALSQAQLRAIAKAIGVTQKSLLEAAPGATVAKKAAEAKPAAEKKTATAAAKPAAKKTAAAKPAAEKKATTSAKKTGAVARKTTAATEKLTAAEKRVLDLYRKADAETKKAAEALLKGEQEEEDGGIVESLLGGAMNLLNTLGK